MRVLPLILALFVAGCDSGEDNKYGKAFPWPECERIQADRTLAERAEYFDRVAREQHIADDDLLRNLYA